MTFRLTRPSTAEFTDLAHREGDVRMASAMDVALVHRPVTGTTASADEPGLVRRLTLAPILLFDLVAGCATLVLAVVIVASRSGGPGGTWCAAFLVLTFLALAAQGQYLPRIRPRFVDDLPRLITALGVAALLAAGVRALAGTEPPVSDLQLAAWVTIGLGLIAGRALLSATRRELRKRGRSGRRTLVVGAGPVARMLVRRLQQQPSFGLVPIGFLDEEGYGDDERSVLGARGATLPVWGSFADFDRVARQQRVSHVVFAFTNAGDDRSVEITRRCEELRLPTSIVPRFFEALPDRMTLDRLGGLPLLSLHAADHRGFLFAIKYATDRIVAALLLLLSAPVFAAVALGVLASLGRPVFFTQRRVGLGGEPFDMLKFRTMRAASDGGDALAAVPGGLGPGGVEGADRRTRFGAFLRRTSLDELPQLLNVLRGDMSLVGPRPERPEFVHRFVNEVHRYGDRHRVKAGITGWAQVHGHRGRTPLADRIELDNYYIQNWTIWLDLRILLLTAGAMLFTRCE